MLDELTKIKDGKPGRFSSWNTTGGNDDAWWIPAGKSVVLADIDGPGKIAHMWMHLSHGVDYRAAMLKFTWDDADFPSIYCPLGDFFGLGNNIVHSYESMLFSVTATKEQFENKMNKHASLQSYIQMPFNKRAVVELVNDSAEDMRFFFYIDYETYKTAPESTGYLHCEWRRENPFGGWADEIIVNTPEANIANKERTAWDNNYLILETKGRGHYIGCNMSITNFQGSWWGEGDDMIWVDGYKWPPDLHGTGSEEYFGHAQGMQKHGYLRHGSSVWQDDSPTQRMQVVPWQARPSGYQSSYSFHIENPVRFNKEIKVTIEHGHGNHLRNEVCSTAYWYATEPTKVLDPLPLEKRMPVLQDNNGNWIIDEKAKHTSREIVLNDEMKKMKKQWADNHPEEQTKKAEEENLM
ncbi:MAG TPA: DUF2961 domain-containing protein [candidate division Zixibacteria bacterium]|nr:DUF2961 domain-containing protein [candidate division Zixibacteria bacterium]